MDELKTIRDEIQADPLGLGYATMTRSQRAASLAAISRTVAKPKALSFLEMNALIPDAEFAAVFDHVNFGEMLDAVRDQRHSSVLAWIGGFARRGVISSGTASALAAYVSAPESTPSSRAVELGVNSEVTEGLLVAAGG